MSFTSIAAVLFFFAVSKANSRDGSAANAFYSPAKKNSPLLYARAHTQKPVNLSPRLKKLDGGKTGIRGRRARDKGGQREGKKCGRFECASRSIKVNFRVSETNDDGINISQGMKMDEFFRKHLAYYGDLLGG